MQQKTAALLLISALSAGVAGCEDAIATGSYKEFGSWTAGSGDQAAGETMEFTAAKSLSDEQVMAIAYLQFPQTYESMKDRFGIPSRRDAANDYYIVGSTGKEIAIQYDGRTATGYSVSN